MIKENLFRTSLKKGLFSRRGITCIVCLWLLFISSFTSVFAQERVLSSSKQLEETRKIFQNISNQNSYVEDLNNLDNIYLPIGMKRTINGMSVEIALTHLSAGVKKTELSVYAKLILPQSNGKRNLKTLFFGAENVRVSHTGGLFDEVKLSLLSDVEIPFNSGNTVVRLKGGSLRRNGSFDTQSYVTIDCKGFKNLSINADVLFPKSLLVPAEDNGEEQVTGHFQTVVEDWSDLLVSIDVPSFEIKGLKDYIFNLRNVVLDLSSNRNKEEMDFPKGYEEEYLTPERCLWRGVYAKEVSITFPKAFSSVKLAAHNLLIDDQGVSGVFAADSLLPLDKGSANGWRFSLDTCSIELLANELKEARFGGRLGLPFKGKNTVLKYDGYLNPNNEYALQVHPDSIMDFSVFNAKAKLEPCSSILLRLKDDKFLPEARLYGEMNLVNVGDQSAKATIPKLHFRDLRVMTVAPYISVESLGYEGKSMLGNMPISINSLDLGVKDGEARLTAGIGLALGEKLFSGKTNMTFVSRYEQGNWSFEKIELDAIALDATIAETIRLNGLLNWCRGDQTYGNGFAGDVNLNLDLKTGKDIAVKARGAFGRKDDFRYWYADGLATFTPSIPIGTGLSITGLGGCVSYNVKPNGRASGSSSFTNMSYVPNEDSGLGFKASTAFAIGKKIGKGEASFEISFTKSGGVALAGLYGYAQFTKEGKGLIKNDLLDKYVEVLGNAKSYSNDELLNLKANNPNKFAEKICPLPSKTDVGIQTTLGMTMDFENKSFHASSEIYVNSPGRFISGTGENGCAGWGVLHIDPKEWYLHLGNPSNRIGLKLNVGNIFGAEAGAYFMSGFHIPDMPAPPLMVTNILGADINKLRPESTESVLKSGKGLAFGADLSINTGDLTCLMMYANFKAGLGFDVMLKDYAKSQCRGRSGTIGLDGWYANGQAYSYLQGELGVKVKLWFIKMRVPVITSGAAALLQTGLPNPTYFKGNLGVHLNVLGIIKGRANFKLQFGEVCDVMIPGNSPIAEPMINDLSPAEGEEEVSVFTVPEATFNIVMGKEVETTGNDGKSHLYRIYLNKFELTDKAGQVVQSELLWSETKTSVKLKAKEILPPNTKLTALVQVKFEEFKNNRWEPVYTSGKPAFEEKKYTFKTGSAPNDIPMENILHTYPVVGQKYFLIEESKEGYVQLDFGQKYLFEKGFDYKLYFLDDTGNKVGTPYKYNEAKNRLEFSIPNLQKKTPYELRLAYKISDEEAKKRTKVKGFKVANKKSYQIGGRKASSSIDTSQEEAILHYSFATSLFSTFRNKIKSLKPVEDWAIFEGYPFYLTADIQAKEAFDLAELKGVPKSGGKALIETRASLEEDYFSKFALPLIYQGYPYASGQVRLSNRDEAEFGVPPHNSIEISKRYLDVLDNDALSLQNFRFPYVYRASTIVWKDFWELLSLIANNRRLVRPQIYNRFLRGNMKVLKYDKYKIELKYMLPNGKESSYADYYLNNPLKLNK